MQPSELRRAAGELGVLLDDVQADRLLRYVELIEKWNARFNLISRRDVGRLWSRHVLDSLSIAPLVAEVQNGADSSDRTITAVDVGTGAGFPGLPLAIALPRVRWVLVDRHQRKIRFLETVIAELGLENATAEVLDLGGEPPGALAGIADVVVSRAVDEPVGLLRLAEPLLAPHARMILLTGASGARRSENTQRLPEGCGYRIGAVREFVIPGLDRAHEVTIIERVTECPDSNEGIRT